MALLPTNNSAERYKPEAGSGGWSWRLLIFTFFIFFAIAASYLGIELGYARFLESQLQDIEAQVAQVAGAISDEDRENLAEFYSRLSNLDTLLAAHVNVTRLFPLLERATHRQVMYDSLDLNTETKELTLSGNAASYEILSRELRAYEQSPEVERVLLQSSDLRENTVSFVVRLVLNSDLFTP